MRRTLGWLVPILFACGQVAQADLFFSEYVEGSGNNKAVEIYNNSTLAADLGNVQVQVYFNGSSSAGTTVNLSGVIDPGGVFVLADDDATFAAASYVNQVTTSSLFNGDDAVVLVQGGAVVDSIGQVGFDPGSAWSAGGVSTQNQTIRRMSAISTGDAVTSDAFDPSLEWSSFAIDDTSDLGMHTFTGTAPTPPPETFAEQNFDVIGPAYPSNPTANSDVFPASSVDQELTNSGSKYDGADPTAGGGLTFHTLWSDSRGNEGPLQGTESGDFIGVNSFAGADAPDVNPSGVSNAAFSQYNYEFNDGDGLLTLAFDPVNIAGYDDVEFNLSYWINDTGYESDDLFQVLLEDELGNQQTLLQFGETELEGNASADDGTANWHLLDFALDDATILEGSLISAIVQVDTNAGDENIFIDDVSFAGVQVPEADTSAIWLIAGVFAVAFVVRVRCRRG